MLNWMGYNQTEVHSLKKPPSDRRHCYNHHISRGLCDPDTEIRVECWGQWRSFKGIGGPQRETSSQFCGWVGLVVSQDPFSLGKQEPLLYTNQFNCQLLQNAHSFPPPRPDLCLYRSLCWEPFPLPILFFKVKLDVTSPMMLSPAFLIPFYLTNISYLYHFLFIHKYLLRPWQCVSWYDNVPAFEKLPV